MSAILIIVLNLFCFCLLYFALHRSIALRTNRRVYYGMIGRLQTRVDTLELRMAGLVTRNGTFAEPQNSSPVHYDDVDGTTVEELCRQESE